MLDGEYNGSFDTINTELEKTITFGLNSYLGKKDETVGLINHYHVFKNTHMGHSSEGRSHLCTDKQQNQDKQYQQERIIRLFPLR